jgi:hypothetical protein
MNIKRLLVDFLWVFAVTLLVMVVVTALWNVIFHRAAAIDWETSVRFSIVFGIVLSWIGNRRKRK